jgi:hypothetical protein
VAYAVPAAAVEPARACFRTHDIRNHTLGDDRTIYLNVNGREVYRVGVRGACLAGATSTDPLVMRQPPGTQIVCRPIELDISVDKGGVESTCIVDSIARMSPAEVEALPPRLRP